MLSVCFFNYIIHHLIYLGSINQMKWFYFRSNKPTFGGKLLFSIGNLAQKLKF